MSSKAIEKLAEAIDKLTWIVGDVSDAVEELVKKDLDYYDDPFKRLGEVRGLICEAKELAEGKD